MSEESAKLVTNSHIFGEMTWLMTQSTRHVGLAMGELTWHLMPAIARRQFYIFKDGDRTVGAAVWAKLDLAGEQLIKDGRFFPPHAGPEAWDAGERIWVTDVIMPFANTQNRHADIMIADLATGVFKHRPFGIAFVDPETHERRHVAFPASLGDRLIEHVKAACIL